MATRYIYLSEELNEKLRKETNASALIQNLLYRHYESDKRKSREEIDKEIIEKEDEISDVNKKLEELKKLELQFLEEKEEEKKKVEEKKQKMISGLSDSFIQFFYIDDQFAKDLALEYYEHRTEKDMNIFEYGKRKGLAPREEKK